MKTNYKNQNDQAVSPVIGVIGCAPGKNIRNAAGEIDGRDISEVLCFWYASTVILAAIVAAFVFGMAGQIQKTKVVAVTAQQPDATDLVITYQGGQDANSLNAIHATLTTGEATAVTYLGEANGATVVKGATPGAAFTTVGTVNVPVGTSIPFKASGTGAFYGKDHLVVVGVFDDGTNNVLLDTFI